VGFLLRLQQSNSQLHRIVHIQFDIPSRLPAPSVCTLKHADVVTDVPHVEQVGAHPAPLGYSLLRSFTSHFRRHLIDFLEQ
jgi:hypothetical protein